MEKYDELYEYSSERNIAPLPDVVVPAMAYVPYQQSGKQYSVETAIEKGTLFPVLNKPFCCTGEV